MGYPTLITQDEAQEAFFQALRMGAGIDSAAEFSGINERTAKRWMQRGRDAEAAAEDNDAPIPDEELRYVEFARKVAKARADSVNRNLAIINRAASQGDPIVDREGRPIRDHTPTNPECPGPGYPQCVCPIVRKAGDYRAATWILEHTQPEKFALIQRTEVTGMGGGPILSHSQVDVEVSVATAVDPRRVALLAKAMADAGMLPDVIDADAIEAPADD